MTSAVCALLAVLFASPGAHRGDPAGSGIRLSAAGSPGGPADARRRARAARAILEEGYQRELPSAGERARDLALQRGRDLPAAPRRRRSELDRGEEPGIRLGALGSIARMLLWALAAAAALLIALALARELGGQGGLDVTAGGQPEQEGAGEAPVRRVVARPLGDADELAARGLFGDAIHVLLLRTLQELAARLPERLPPSLTSREILARVHLPQDARAALAVLVGAVEVSHFGGVEPDSGDFARCRQQFQRFAEAYLRGVS